MKYLFILFIGFFVITASHAEVYKYTNKQGKTSYSDIPINNAVKVKVPPVMTYQPQPVVIQAMEQVEPTKSRYTVLKIMTPEDEGTVRDNQGNVAVSFTLEPSLLKGDRLELYIDGIKQPALIGLGLNRGEHQVFLQAVSKQGKVWLKSEQTTFYLHHASKLINPQTKPKPKPPVKVIPKVSN